MFDIDLPELDQLAGVDDRALVSAITGWAQAEAAAAARRLAAIAELTARRVDDAGACSRWACDGWDAAAAEVAAASGLTRGRASNQMYQATALRNRLPKVAALFAEGVLSAAVVGAIVWHTTLIDDPHALAVVDTFLAGDALRYGQLSAAKTVAAIHAIIEAHDPDAVRRTRDTAQDRDLVVDGRRSESGITGLWGRLYAHDADRLDRRLAAMAHGVCDDDPRTLAQRRADALGALAAGADRLACACEDPDCPTKTGAQPAPATGAVVYVLAEQQTVTTPADARLHGETVPEPPRRNGLAPIRLPDRKPVKPAQILGGPLLPAPVLAELLRTGATVTPLRPPGPDSAPEPHYRPSARLADFIRARDLTCRFPGCDCPAQLCDIDHGAPWGDGGATHPSNLRLLCRKHHLLKTFWGWRDRQHPDGSIDWISPTGHTYTTHPGARQLFPALCEPTGTPPAPAPPDPHRACRIQMMPARTRTRSQARAHSIQTERSRNRQAPQQHRPHHETRAKDPPIPAPAPHDNDPPPF